MCVRLHAAQSTSLEHPGLASLGAHALKLLTFPNLYPRLLIVVKNWTQPPTLRSCVVDLDLTAFTSLLERGVQKNLLSSVLTCNKWWRNETGLIILLICRTKSSPTTNRFTGTRPISEIWQKSIIIIIFKEKQNEIHENFIEMLCKVSVVHWVPHVCMSCQKLKYSRSIKLVN